MKLLEKDIIQIVRQVYQLKNVVRMSPSNRGHRGIPDLFIYGDVKPNHWLEIKVDGAKLSALQLAFLKLSQNGVVLHVDNKERQAHIVTENIQLAAIVAQILGYRLKVELEDMTGEEWHIFLKHRFKDFM